MELDRKKASPLLLLLLALVSVVAFRLVACHPDRPLPQLQSDSSSERAFFVQLVRPRVALPLGGLVPPEWLGADARLGFDSETPGASGSASPDRVELSAVDWSVRLELKRDGSFTEDSEVTFSLHFQGERRAVRCRPVRSRPERWEFTRPAAGELSGLLELGLTPCVDAATGASLGWPPAPLRLRAGFARLSAPVPAAGVPH